MADAAEAIYGKKNNNLNSTNWGIGSAQLGTTQGVAGQRHRPLSHRFWWAQHSAFGYNISILIKKLTILIYKYYNLIDNYIIYLIISKLKILLALYVRGPMAQLGRSVNAGNNLQGLVTIPRFSRRSCVRTPLQ
ncbi:unnamed protein product [Fusarium graminearum]|uniref:Chromosome 2, complete genome n=1 Tax=Gibberella zeae (strain ATCC MYA-4620 / CBS 123657 / FGSC 9075 / NRRL 31084 / PH-1) TaxID=229533 RepID=A0A1C3YLZ0_GIBZE|nr:unnamed protein product [Fusarium graminearum]